MEHFNNLSPPEDERLAILTEELGESLQAIGKIFRHGYDSDNNGERETTNRTDLMRELNNKLNHVRVKKSFLGHKS